MSFKTFWIFDVIRRKEGYLTSDHKEDDVLIFDVIIECSDFHLM